MARPEQCSGCEKKTTIHFTQIINNKVYKLDMCEDCPLKKEVIDPGNFSLTDIFKTESNPMTQKHADLVCESCGMTQVEFEKRGRFGCPDCYTHFESLVLTVAKDMHYGVEHKGKRPSLAVKRIDLNNRIQQMQEELQSAVKLEKFEQAAILRDKIHEIESQIGDLNES